MKYVRLIDQYIKAKFWQIHHQMIASRRKLSADCSRKLADIEEAQRKIEKERDENVLRKSKYKFQMELVQNTSFCVF